MKKILILVFCSILFLVVSCQSKEEEKIYQQGDQITEDGIIYTYYTFETLYRKDIKFL